MPHEYLVYLIRLPTDLIIHIIQVSYTHSRLDNYNKLETDACELSI